MREKESVYKGFLRKNPGVVRVRAKFQGSLTALERSAAGYKQAARASGWDGGLLSALLVQPLGQAPSLPARRACDMLSGMVPVCPGGMSSHWITTFFGSLREERVHSVGICF